MNVLGLCYGSKFDSHYRWTGEMLPDGEEKYTFQGFATSFLSWNGSIKSWVLNLNR
jgi:hypothetical protein